MNIAILGKNAVNETLCREFEQAGFPLSVIEDIATLKSISGSKGAFRIKSADAVTEASHIVVSAAPARSIDIALPGAMLLSNDSGIDQIVYGSQPVAFVLDYLYDSSAQSTRKTLRKALAIARKKTRVICFAKNVRTAGDSLENLYREARQEGVLFYKYDDIAIAPTDNGSFYFKAVDQGESIDVIARAVIFDGEADNSFEKLLKLLRVKTNSDATSFASAYFIFPSLTSRAGVYFINPYAASGSENELTSQVQSILSDIRGDQWNAAALLPLREALLYPDGYADVDAEKCAFCYTCYRACPHAAMAPDNEKSAMKNLNDSCKGCGICYSICPANAISMKLRKETAADKPSGSIRIFCCKNSGELALKKIAESLKAQMVSVSVSPVSCGGEITVDVLLNALKEARRVIVAVCMDDACRHFDGNKRARREAERAREMLKASGRDENMVRYIQLSHVMPLVLEGYINKAANEALKEQVI